jgi:hypothetical protein
MPTNNNKVQEPSYVEWLANLKVGDKVKIGDCKHSSCDCKLYTVQGLLPAFGDMVYAVGDGDCQVRQFDPANGREIGNKKGTYKNGYLAQVKQSDLDAIAADERREQRKKVSHQLSQRLEELSAKHFGITLTTKRSWGYICEDGYEQELEALQKYVSHLETW